MPRDHRLITILCNLFLLAGTTAHAAIAPEKVDEIVRANGYADDAPGVAVMLIHKGQVVFQKGYGLSNVRDGRKITPQTTFELASVSKTFTSTAVMILHDRGNVAFDDDIRTHIPELPEYQPGRPITVANLLQHTSGLPEYLEFTDVRGHDRGFLCNADYAPEFARLRETFGPRFEPGERHGYSNSNYMLLGLLIERVSGKSFGTFLRDEIFAPLGMTGTWVYESPKSAQDRPGPKDRCAIGYRKTSDGWREDWGVPPIRQELLTVGDGAVWTNLQDLALWDAAVRDGKLIKPQAWRRALTPVVTRDGKSHDYGFGWQLDRGPRGRVRGFGHGGSWGGFGTWYWRYQRDDLTIVLLSNRGDLAVGELAEALRALSSRRAMPSR